MFYRFIMSNYSTIDFEAEKMFATATDYVFLNAGDTPDDPMGRLRVSEVIAFWKSEKLDELSKTKFTEAAVIPIQP